MRVFSHVWILIAAVCGAAYGARGYNPESLRGLLWLAGFLAVFITVAAALTPVLVRVDGGRWDWQKARADAAPSVAGGVVLSALMLGGAGVYWLAADATGGWPGGWLHAAFGAMTGAVVAISVRLAVSGLRLFERLGIRDREAEPGAAADCAGR